jgi:hypothetical protein
MKGRMELRPRRNDNLRCSWCHELVPAANASFVRDKSNSTSFASLAVHPECFSEIQGDEDLAQRFVLAPLAYGFGTELELASVPALHCEALRELGAEEGPENLNLQDSRARRLIFARGGRVHGVVLGPTQIAARGRFAMENPGRRFVSVYEPLAIVGDDVCLRLCLDDALGLRIEKGLVFSGGRMLREGVYHSSASYSRGLVTLRVSGLVSVVYGEGDFVDVNGEITLSKPPSNLAPENFPKHRPAPR